MSASGISPTSWPDLARSWSTLCVARCEFARTGLVGWALLAPEKLREAALSLLEADYLLEDVNGLDTRDGLEVVYHFDPMTKEGRIALRVLVPHDNPVLPTISDLFQGAAWHEREAAEFYGLTFTGHPNPWPLLLPDDFSGPPPLLKQPEARAPLAVILPPSEIISCEPAFKALVTPVS